jgi:tetratricopeptide (TPR) repeat protein
MSESCIQHIASVWKEKTNAANQFFNEGNFKKALLVYEEALFRAEVLCSNKLKTDRLGVPHKQIFAISCNNIAYTYEEIGEIKKGEKMLQRVVYYFLFLTKENQGNNSIIQKELKRALFTYIDFANRNNLEANGYQKIVHRIQQEFKTIPSI